MKPEWMSSHVCEAEFKCELRDPDGVVLDTICPVCAPGKEYYYRRELYRPELDEPDLSTGPADFRIDPHLQ